MQPDGKIVIGGSSGNTVTDNFVVARLNPDGSSDSSFSGDGAASADFGGADRINSAALQADGKIVVAGVTEQSGVPSDVAVARFNPNGTLDSSFDGDGMATLDYFGGVDAAEAVVVQPDGGSCSPGTAGARCFMLTRLDADGSPDGVPGRRHDRLGTFCVRWDRIDAARGAALQADGKIVVAGTTFADASNGTWRSRGSSPRLARRTHVRRHRDQDDRPRRRRLRPQRPGQPNGKIVLAGAGTAAELMVTRLNANGSID